jgi:PAS domain S-box-containing protein
MAPFPTDEAIARMSAFHDRLDAAAPDEVRYAAAFCAPPEGVGAHEIDGAGIIRRVNAQELALLGYTEAGMVGHPVTEFILMREASERAIGQRLEGARDTKPFVRAFRRADGSAVMMLLMVRILRGPQGDTRGIRTLMTEAPLPG